MEENRRTRQRERERKIEMRRRQVRRQKMILGGGAAGILLLLILVLAVRGIAGSAAEKARTEKMEKQEQAQKAREKEPEKVSLTISAAGDCTLGTDENFYYATSLPAKYEAVQDPGYFFQKVLPVFSKDDLTIVNMEGTLTQETAREAKLYAFKGDEEYTQILTEGSVEAANLANNHSHDYGEKSYTDTIQALEDAGITTFGYDRTAVMDIKGIKVGLLGTYELADHMGCEEEMIKNIQSLQEQGAQIIIASFHWGIERENIPNEIQVDLAHSAIDHGADLVLGHHPHVLQGIETYKGKNIVYSLGNFCFGGNSGPNDMDAMIFQQTFTLEDGELTEDNVTNVVPVKISGSWAQGVNDYQPIPVEGDLGEAIIERVEEYSQGLAQQYGTEAAQIQSSLDKDQEENGQTETVSGAAVEE